MIESQEIDRNEDLFQSANQERAKIDSLAANTVALSLSQGQTLQTDPNAPQTLSEALVAIAEHFPNKDTVYLHSDGSISTQSYQSLLQKSLKILVGLKKQGLMPQDKVILQLENNQEFTEGFWGCTLGGFVTIPLAIASEDEPSSDAAQALYHSWQIFDRPLVLTSKQLEPKIISLFSQWNLDIRIASIEDLSSQTTLEPEAWHRGKPDDLTLLFLNGRFGKIPKGVQLSHRNIISNIIAYAQKGWMNGEDVYLNWLPLYNPGPLLRSVIWTTYLGCQQIQGEAATVLVNPLKWLDWIEQYRATITWSPNFALALLNDHAEKIKQGTWDLSSVKYWLNTAEPIVPKTARASYQLLQPHGLKEGVMHGSWGMKETAASATDSDIYASQSQLDKDDTLADLGLPLPGVSLRIVDDHNKIIPEQTIGNLQVKGATVTPGYYKSPKLNQEVFTEDGWYKTGDLGFLSEGRLTLTGRSKALIIINGKNHYSHEIERVVNEIAGIEANCTAACGIRQSGGNTDSVVIFFNTSISDNRQLVKLLQEIKKNVAVKIGINPAYLIPLKPSAIPRTAKGIIDRQQLQQDFTAGEFARIWQTTKNLLAEANNLSRSGGYSAPESEIELQLAKIWQKLLNIKQIDKRDSFFELGGHSLLAIEMFARIESQLNRKLPVNALFDASTIEQLAQILEQLNADEPWDCLAKLKPGGKKPALFLIHDGDGDVMLYLNLARHLHPDRPVYGLRPYGKEGFPILDWAMKQIVDRYVEKILSVQPEGPYFIGGLCDGGVYGYEVGQQLQARGHQIGFIALFDAIDFEAVRYEHSEDVKKIHERPKYELYRHLLSSGANLPQLLKNQISVRMMLRLAKEGHTPQKFTGKLLLFRATAKEFIPSETPQYLKIEDPLFGWQKRATEGVEVYDIFDSHSGILREPSVKILANQLQKAFAKSDRLQREDRSLNSIESVETNSQVEFKVSIVILARNSSKLVIKTLESLFQQTFEFWEAIVVYDRSCDRLYRDLISFAEKDPRIILVPHSQTTNSAARNLGAKSAQHEWLLFIDAGDWLFPEHLEKLTAQLATAPEFDVVFCNWILVTAEGQKTDSFAYNVDRFSELEEGLFNHLDICNQFPLHACLISKAVFNKASGFTAELATCEDWDLWQRIVALRGVFHTSIDLTLAGCLPKPKEVLADSQQLLHDGLQIIAREYKSDSRLKQPSNSQSSPRRKIGDAQFYWTGYCASRAIALGEDYLSLLNHLANLDSFAALSIDFELVYLDRAIINGIRDAADTNSEDFPTLWQRIQPEVVHFFQELSQCSGIPFQILPRVRSIETIILERIVQTRPLTLTQFHAINCDLTQPISTQTVPSENEILNCCVQLEEKVLGSINLPVFDGQVSNLVLADAIANRYAWKILDYFFKQTVYSELTITNTESGIVVKRGNCTLIEGLTPSPNLRHEISEKITWTIFLQELWGAIDWQQNDLSSDPKSQAIKIDEGEWLVVELSDSLTDVIASQNLLQVVVQIGGVSIGIIPVAVEAKILTAARLRTEIIEQAGFELARAAVREGLLGKPLNGELSLRERLSQAAKQKRDLNPLQAIASNALPNTGNLLNQSLSPEPNSLVIGYRQTQPIGTSASRWATLPTALIDELSKCTSLHGESAIEIGDSGRSPQQILYSPDLILPQISEQNNTLISNLGDRDIHLSGYTTELPILMYHQVSPLASNKPNRWHLSSELFEQQLRYLRDRGFYSVTLEDWRKSIVTRQPLPGNALIITFDDGYQNFFTHAWPLLKKYGFSAMVFVIANRIGTQLEDYQLMGWQEIKQLQQEGVQFGSHSLDHASFSDLSNVELVRQAIGSRAILTKELGVPINAIAYPYGDCSSLVRNIVGSCGYVFGLNIGFNRSTWKDSLLGLSRIEIKNIDSLPRFTFKLG